LVPESKQRHAAGRMLETRSKMQKPQSYSAAFEYLLDTAK